jgi:hypothetical protein
MAKKEYYRIDNIIKTESVWNMIFGKRSNGKSYAVKEYAIKDAIESINNKNDIDKKRFFYLRRYSDDVDVFSVCKYLEDMNIVKNGNYNKIYELSNGRFNKIKAAKQKIFVCFENEDGKEEDIQCVGYYNNIGNAERLKSQSYLDVYNLIFEEFIASSKPYLNREPEKLESIVSTIARDRKIKVFLIGNNDDRDCVYFDYFGLDHVKKQKEGTIETYEHSDFDEEGNEIVIRFAVEFAGNTVGKSGMFFGKGSKIIETGEWRANKQPYLSYEEFQNDDHLYEVYFERNKLKWKCTFCYNEKSNGYYWYVLEHNRDFRKSYRIISDIVSMNPMQTKGLIPLSSGEEFAFDFFKNDKMFFVSSLTGTEFKRALKTFINSNFERGD